MAEVCFIDWHVTPFRVDRFLEIWRPSAARVLAYGARSWLLTRSIDDPLHVRQAAVWESRDDFDRYWFSEETAAAREQAINYYGKPVSPVWHSLVGAE